MTPFTGRSWEYGSLGRFPAGAIVPPRSRAIRLAALLTAAAIAPAVLPGPASAQSPATFGAAADAHVSSAYPGTNYGASSSLKLDASPLTTAYVRFNVANLSAIVSKATLRGYTNSSNSGGIDARAVADTSWTESAITYANAPAVSSTSLSKSGAFSKSQWISLDVTAAVKGNGAVTLALKTPSTSSLLLASRQAGSARAPRLVVETGGAPAPAPAPSPSPDPAPAPEPAPTPSPEPIPEPTPLPPLDPGSPFERRPYTDASPWNTPIPATVSVNPNSAASVATIASSITSDPSQYTYPVYFVDATTPMRSVTVTGVFSEVNGTGSSDGALQILSSPLVPVPARDDFAGAAGTDGQIIIVNQQTGDEWSFWQLRKDSAGNWLATNGSHYNVYWDGHPPRSASNRAYTARGAGVTYLSGLIRPWEIKQGRIDHALAFAYNYPSPNWIYPASKSDGKNLDPNALPEGARLQLDPAMTETELRSLGCSTAAIVIARAMQQYGMYVIDNSGRPKIMLEYNATANPAWSTLGVGTSTPSCIPIKRLRWIAGPAPIDQ